MTGSGLPMRFVDPEGRLLPMLQQGTELDDSALISNDDAQLRIATSELAARMRELLRIARREHVPLTVLHHPHWWCRTHGTLQTELLARARTLGVPVWGAAEWLRFVDARAATVLRRRSDEMLVSVQRDGVSLLLEGAQRIELDGQPVQSAGSLQLGGIRYSLLVLSRGPHVVRAADIPPRVRRAE
jgi:hypothetical protein